MGLQGGSPKLFDRLEHQIKSSFLKAGYKESEIPGAAAGEKAAIAAAHAYIVRAKTTVLPKGCTLSMTRIKQIAALAAHSGREVGAVEGEKGGIKATQKSAKMLESLASKTAISLATEHNAKETAKAGASHEAARAGTVAGTHSDGRNQRRARAMQLVCQSTDGTV